MTEEKGFLYKKGTDERIPYWVDRPQAEKLAEEEGGTIDSFYMRLPGYGIMDAVEWEFRVASPEEIIKTVQWNTS